MQPPLSLFDYDETDRRKHEYSLDCAPLNKRSKLKMAIINIFFANVDTT